MCWRAMKECWSYPMPDRNYAWLDQHPEEAQRRDALRAAARALAEVHKAGMTHGRPYVRDMT